MLDSLAFVSFVLWVPLLVAAIAIGCALHGSEKPSPPFKPNIPPRPASAPPRPFPWPFP